MKIAVLGASGMVGHMILRFLAEEIDADLIATTKTPEKLPRLKDGWPQVDWRVIDASQVDTDDLTLLMEDVEWAINAIGFIKHRINEKDPEHIQTAIRINALFPFLLESAAHRTRSRIIQISTDCVFSGAKGNYREGDTQDPSDVYGKTKCLGELHDPANFTFRSSIIGPELAERISLFEWFRSQPEGSQINGYTNHQWNGITSLAFAKIVAGIIRNPPQLPRIQHLVPADRLSKYELLMVFQRVFNRMDIGISPVAPPTGVDRTLVTENHEGHQRIWNGAGYSQIPCIEDLVFELADYLGHHPQKQL